MNLNNVIRQGDTQPREYQLDPGNLNLNLANKEATIRLMTGDYRGIAYDTTATVSSENKISFSIEDIIPAREYRLEVTVDDYVFPSRALDGQFSVDPSSHGQEVNIIQIIGKDEIVRDVKAQVNTELQPLVTSLESAQQAELDRQAQEVARGGAESTRETNEQTRLNKDLLRDDKIAQMEADKDAVIANATVDSEVILARGGKATLGQRLDETTAQLAQKATKGEIALSDLNKNKVQFDGTWFSDGFLQDLSGGELNTTNLLDESVTSKKLSRNAVTYEKQDVIAVDNDKALNLKVTNDVSHLYKFDWLNFITYDWNSSPSERSVIAPIKRNSKIRIETVGTHNRFTIFTSKYNSASQTGRTFKTVYVKGGDGISTGNESYEFFNEDDDFVIIGITTDSQKPQVFISESFQEGSRKRLDSLVEGYPTLKNTVVNGDFSNGLDNWTADRAVVSAENGFAKLLATEQYGRLSQGGHQRTEGYKYYISAEIETTSNQVGIHLYGTITPQVISSGSGYFEQISTVYTAPTTGFWNFGVLDKRETNWNEFKVKNFVLIDLTSIYGAGNEPSKAEMDFILNEYLNGFFKGSVSDYVTLRKIANASGTKQTPSVVSGNTGITRTKDVYPVMFGVKMGNSRDNEMPRPMGWLYYVPEAPYEMLYASGSPENMKHLGYWDLSKTWDGTKDPSWYRPHITKEGDIIFVYRGDRHGLGTTDPNSRQNPIIYPAGDWNNPIEIEFGTRLKPTSWLQNSGVEHIYNGDFFLFAEYTRPHHETCNTWKVTKPYKNPDNWKTVQSFELSGSNQTGMKHLHQVDYDPFSGSIFTSTGDDDDSAKVYRSDDNGETWSIVLEGQRRYARVLNFIFTKEKVYWANDDSAHGFYSVDRDENGKPDFDNITTLFDLTGHPPTYVNALVDDPHGILIFNRFDGTSNGPLIVHFWDIENEQMHEVLSIDPIQGEESEWGFRVEAVNFYQTRGGNETVVGFFSPANRMDLLGNESGDDEDRINNLVFKVIKDGDEFRLDVSALTDRS